MFTTMGRQSSQISEPYKEELLEEIKEKDIITTKTVVISGQAANGSEKSSNSPIAEKKKSPRWDSTHWYNTEYAQLFEQVSGQPPLTEPQHYGQSQKYFHRLSKLNPNATSEEVYQIATEGAELVYDSYQYGGPFEWLTSMPDIGVLVSQAERIDITLKQIKNIPKGERIEQEETANAVAELNAINEAINEQNTKNQESGQGPNALGSGCRVLNGNTRH